MSRLRVHIIFSNLHNQCRVDFTMKLDNHYQLNINHLKKAAILDVWDNITVGEHGLNRRSQNYQNFRFSTKTERSHF